MARRELEGTIETYIRNGYHIVSDSTNTVTLKRDGESVSHALHLILTLLTAGFWLIIWLLIICSTNEQASYVTISYNEENGTVSVNDSYKGETINNYNANTNDRTTNVKDDIVEQMRQYKELLDLGIITQEEYDKKKKEILE